MLSDDLKLTIKVTSVMLETFYPVHVLRRLPISEEDYWEQKNIDFRNWKGELANHVNDKPSNVKMDCLVLHLSNSRICMKYVQRVNYKTSLKASESLLKWTFILML